MTEEQKKQFEQIKTVVENGKALYNTMNVAVEKAKELKKKKDEL